MKKIILLICCFLTVSFALAQEKGYEPNPKYPDLFKTLDFRLKASDPQWVKEMYGENPNFFKITQLYDEYYKTNILEKTVHTQNYKNFYRIVSTNQYYDDLGNIIIKVPDDTQLKNAKKSYAKAANASGWTFVAPFETFQSDGNTKSSQANVYYLTQSKSNPNVLYCGTETGGVFKTTDKGENWIEVGANVFDYGSTDAIKIDPNNENVVYEAHDARLFKTTDGGVTWTLLLTAASSLRDVEVNPNNSNIVLISGDFGFKRSTDGGQTWTNILTDKITDIEFKSDDPNVVFVAKLNPNLVRYEIWKSTDNGLTFSAKTDGWYVPTNGVANSAGGARIANTKADSNRLYVLLLGNDIDYSTDLNYIGIYRTDDAGETWTLPYDGNGDSLPDNNPGGPYSSTHWAMSTFNVNGGTYDQGYYNAAIDVSDTNADVFLVGMLNLFKSTDGGKTFKLHGGYGCTDCSNRYRHPDIQSISIQDNDVFVTNDGGVDKYDQNLEFVDSKNKGITASDLWGFDQGWNEDVLVGGRYHNGNMAYHENYQNGKTLSLGGAESRTGFVNLGENKKVYHDDISGKIIPLTIPGEVISIPKLALFPNSGGAGNNSGIVNDPRWWNNIYIGKDNKVWKSVDYGQSYTLLKEFGASTDRILDVEISRNNPDLIFVNHNGGSFSKLWRSTDAGLTWTEMPLPVTTRKYSMSLNEENELYVSFDYSGTNTNKVYKSTNFGQSWTNITSTTLNGYAILDTQVQEGTNGGVYAICQKNVFYKNNTMSDWVNISEGIPASFRFLKAKPFYKAGKLRLGSNRGVWERSFYEPSVPKAQPMVANEGVFCDRKEIQFEDYSALNHTGATWQWDFPGAATVSSTTVRNPLVTYTTPGSYNVTLTVTNAQGTSTKTVQNMIVVNPSVCMETQFAGKAAKFDGVNSQYLTKNFSTPKTVSNFTFSAWIKPEGIQQNYSSVIYANGNENENGNGITLDFKNSKNELGTHCGGQWGLNSGLIVPKDKWSYVALIYTPTKVTLVLNEKTYVINGTFTAQNLTNLDLGIHDRRDDRQYKGLLDEVCLWDRALSLDELRLNKHLTKVNSSDANLFAYYQFNNISNGEVYDVKNTNDLSVVRNMVVVDSTCPVGEGISQKLSVTQNNTQYDFSNVNMKLTTGSSNFNGDVYATKLNTTPFLKPTENSDINSEYYFIENYGTSSNIGNLGNLEFSSVQNIGSFSNTQIKLYQRERNSDSDLDWADKGNPEIINSNTIRYNLLDIVSNIPFNNDATNNTLAQSSGQFYLKSSSSLRTDNNQSTNKIIAYPNPSSVESGFSFQNIGKNALINIYDASGKVIYKGFVNENEKLYQCKTAGVYFYTIETNNKIVNGKIIIK